MPFHVFKQISYCTCIFLEYMYVLFSPLIMPLPVVFGLVCVLVLKLGNWLIQ